MIGCNRDDWQELHTIQLLKQLVLLYVLTNKQASCCRLSGQKDATGKATLMSLAVKYANLGGYGGRKFLKITL